jgi:hypothetical protein
MLYIIAGPEARKVAALPLDLPAFGWQPIEGTYTAFKAKTKQDRTDTFDDDQASNKG